MKLINRKFVFEIPKTPAWITFVTLIKDVIINIINNKEKPGMYTIVCDDIYWIDLLEYLEKINVKPRYRIINQQSNFVNKLKVLYTIF